MQGNRPENMSLEIVVVKEELDVPIDHDAAEEAEWCKMPICENSVKPCVTEVASQARPATDNGVKVELVAGPEHVSPSSCDLDEEPQNILYASHAAKNEVVTAPKHLQLHNNELPARNYIYIDGMPLPCVVCGKEFRKLKDLKRHETVHSAEKYSCEICGRLYIRPHQLEYHRRTHTREKKTYTCGICKKVFSKLYNLKTHILIHTEIKPYSCEICKQKFKLSTDLVAHKSTHNNKKPFSCEVCSKTFKLKIHLDAHKQVHTGEHTCQVCDKRFSLSSHLKIHARAHNNATPYACNTCDKKCKTLCALMMHERTHRDEKSNDIREKEIDSTSSMKNLDSGDELNKNIESLEKVTPIAVKHKCEICEKTFKCSSYLWKHRRVHTGAKPYSCDVCDMKFTHINTYKRHKLSHTGEMPYSCDVCNVKFKCSSNLSRHKRLHTREHNWAEMQDELKAYIIKDSTPAPSSDK